MKEKGVFEVFLFAMFLCVCMHLIFRHHSHQYILSSASLVTVVVITSLFFSVKKVFLLVFLDLILFDDNNIKNAAIMRLYTISLKRLKVLFSQERKYKNYF